MSHTLFKKSSWFSTFSFAVLWMLLTLPTAQSQVKAEAEGRQYFVELGSIQLDETGDKGKTGEIEPYITVLKPMHAQDLSYKEEAYKATTDKYISANDGERARGFPARKILIPASLRQDGSVSFLFGVWERDVLSWATLLEDQFVTLKPSEIPAGAKDFTVCRSFVGTGSNKIEVEFFITEVTPQNQGEASAWNKKYEDEVIQFAEPQSPLGKAYFADIEGTLRQRIAEQVQTKQDAQLAEIRELVRIERYYATLKFKKTSYTLDLDRHFDNWLASKTEKFEVGQTTYEKMVVGEKLSQKFDFLTAIFSDDLDLSTYNVIVKDKKTEVGYFLVPKSGKEKVIPEKTYQELIARASKAMPHRIATSHYNGVDRTRLLDSSLEDLKVISKKPLKRYFVDVKIHNVTYTLDLFKHAKNALLDHELTFEVSKEQYESGKDLWTPHFGFSPLITGYFSRIKGTVQKKWTVEDPNYIEVETDTDVHLVLSRSEADLLR